MLSFNCGKRENINVKYDIDLLERISGHYVTWLVMNLLSQSSSHASSLMVLNISTIVKLLRDRQKGKESENTQWPAKSAFWHNSFWLFATISYCFSPHLAVEHKGFFEGWRYCRLLDVPPPAGCFNHTHKTHTHTHAHTVKQALSGMLKAHPRHRRSSLDVSKGAVLERQQERCEEEKICGLWPQRKWFIQDYKASPQDRCWAVILE